MKKISLVIATLVCFCLHAQDNDTTEVDSTHLQAARKAMFMSLIVPGSGQIYNHFQLPKGKKGNVYWKLPLIYGGLGYMGYSFFSNQHELSKLKKEYYNRLETPAVISDEYKMYDSNDLKILYQKKQNSRDLAILGFVGIYAIQAIDANIESHFIHFDVTPDVSFQVRPKLYTPNSAGLAFNLNFR